MKFTAIVATILIGSSICAGAYAQTVKKWVDEEGVTHYSDQKPAEGESAVEEIEVPEAAVTEFESEEASERIKKQLQQMEQDRLAREQEAEAKEKAKALDEALEREPIVADEKKERKKKKRGRDEEYKGPYPMPIEERQKRDFPTPAPPSTPGQ